MTVGPLRSGNHAANAAWTACAVTAFTIARAVAAGVAADQAKMRWASLRASRRRRNRGTP